MAKLKGFATTDWREQLRKNQRKTRWVIVIFIALYVLVGLLIDLLLHGGSVYPESALQRLLTLQFVPYATLAMGTVAVVSLLIAYAFYDRIMLLGTQYHEVTNASQDLTERQLYNVVEEMKVAAGLNYLPKIYIIEASYMNAFASGFSEKSALVAITRGLLEKLDRNELQAVMAHELSHIRHLDIKLTLTVAILSNIMLIAIDILFRGVIYGPRRRGGKGANYVVLVIVLLRMALPIITLLLTLYLSRKRELMADAGCVELMRNNEPLANALLKIHQDHQQNHNAYRQEYGQTAHEDVRRAAYIFDPVKAGIEPVKDVSSVFSTHPTLKERLHALGFKK